MKWKLFIGRWCPFHEGHKYIIDAMLAGGHAVVIAVRDSEDEITADVRASAIYAVYSEQADAGKLKVCVIPDIDMVCVGRGVGYGLVEAPAEIQEISGTEIRAGRRHEVVPEAQEVYNAWPKLSQT